MALVLFLHFLCNKTAQSILEIIIKNTFKNLETAQKI